MRERAVQIHGAEHQQDTDCDQNAKASKEEPENYYNGSHDKVIIPGNADVTVGALIVTGC